ncbi:MAG TPA: hypothetical protein EYP14_14215, partial [Planctomycetaceae bacterium]|nr:hypothetical protein [Planctomycetaceae bacterium]
MVQPVAEYVDTQIGEFLPVEPVEKVLLRPPGALPEAASGTLVFAQGQTTATFSVVVFGDSADEANEVFFVLLSNATGAELADPIGQATIVDDDFEAGQTLPDAPAMSPTATDTGSPVVRLNNGPGDGSVDVLLYADGNFSGATYDPVGPTPPPATTVYESSLYFRNNTADPTGQRQILDSGSATIFTDPAQPMVAWSTFSVGGLQVELAQMLVPLNSRDGQIGSLLAQTYRLTNSGSTNLDFELVRYMDGDLFFDRSLVDGGGRLISQFGEEILFETDAGGTGQTDTTFLGITGRGGTAPTSNRYEIDEYPGLGSRIAAGTSLDDTITGDGDGDGFIDPGNEYDVVLALRNIFSLAPGSSAVYTTHTLWGSGAPDIEPPPSNTVSIADATMQEGDFGTSNMVFTV